MAAKSTLNAKNLESLGAERLSELLIELSAGDATAKSNILSPKERRSIG